jgi:hypothetical protein
MSCRILARRHYGPMALLQRSQGTNAGPDLTAPLLPAGGEPIEPLEPLPDLPVHVAVTKRTLTGPLHPVWNLRRSAPRSGPKCQILPVPTRLSLVDFQASQDYPRAQQARQTVPKATLAAAAGR